MISTCNVLLQRNMEKAKKNLNAYKWKISSRPTGKYTGTEWQRKKELEVRFDGHCELEPLFSSFSHFLFSALGYLQDYSRGNQRLSLRLGWSTFLVPNPNYFIVPGDDLASFAHYGPLMPVFPLSLRWI